MEVRGEADADSTPPSFQVAPLLNSAGHAASFEKLFYCFKSSHIRFPSLTGKGIFTKTTRRNAPAYSQWVHYEHPCNGIKVAFIIFLVFMAKDLLEVFICLIFTVLEKFKKNKIRKTFF